MHANTDASEPHAEPNTFANFHHASNQHAEPNAISNSDPQPVYNADTPCDFDAVCHTSNEHTEPNTFAVSYTFGKPNSIPKP